MKDKYIPVTPAGTMLFHLVSDTEDLAWKALMKDAVHMPYKNKKEFKKRGYTVELEEVY